MKQEITAAAVGLACIVTIGCAGQSSAGEFLGLEAHFGTLGPGAEISLSLWENTRLRGGLNYFDFSLDGESNDVDYDFDTKLRSFSLLFDYHPMGGTFFLTGGAYINNNEVGVAGTFATGNVPDPLASFLDRATVASDVDFNTFAPYLGLGWRSNNGESGWAVACSLGVMYQGAPDVHNTRVEGTIDINSIPEVQAYLEKEEKEIEDELSWFEFYPVATLQLVYHF